MSCFCLSKGGNSLTTKKQTAKFLSANFKKMLSPIKLYHSEDSNSKANRIDLDEVAQHEPPHQDLHCLQIQLFFVSDTERVLKSDRKFARSVPAATKLAWFTNP